MANASRFKAGEEKTLAEKAELSARLSEALWGKSLEATRKALAAGADPNARDAYGDVPLRLALMGSCFEAARELAEAGARVGAISNEAPLLSNLMWSMDEPAEAARWLLERGADPSQSDGSEDDQRPLHFAAVYGRLESIAALAEAGADVNERNGAGMTPLMLAACAGHLACCQRLLNLGARAQDRDNAGHDALYWARGRDKEGEGVVELLLSIHELKELEAQAKAAPASSRGRAL